MSYATIKLRSDLIFSEQSGPEGRAFVVKDPASGRFFRFREAEYFILRQLDGTATLDSVRQRAEDRFGGALPAETLRGFVERLRQLGLLEDAARTSTVHRHGRIGGDIFYLRLKAFDPDAVLDKLVGKLRFLFTPQFVGFSALLMLFAVGLTVSNWPEMSRDFQSLLHLESLFVAWVVILVVIVFHEFAHGLTCKHFGGHVHEMGFMLIYFQPAFYCNVSDAWLFPEKAKRLWVTFAGAYFEFFLWALSTLVWRVSEPQTVLNRLSVIVVMTSALKWMINLNPLIKLDGYYLLSDFLDAPNLRRRASEYLRARVGALFGPPTEWLKKISSRERRIYLVYGLVAGAFSTWLLSVVLVGVGGYMVRQYQAWGFVLFAALVGGVFRYSIQNSVRVLKSSFQRERTAPIAWRKPVKIGTLLALMAAVLAFGRLELKVSGEFVILPIRNADVRAEVEGIIQEILVDEGVVVSRGEPIAQLSDRDFRADLRKVNAEIAESKAKLKMLEAGARPEEIQLARTAIAKAEARLTYGTNELSRYKALFEQKLLARKELEGAEEEVSVRQKELEEAKDHLRVLQAGSRPEEIEATKAGISRLVAQQRYLEEQSRLLTLVSPVAGVVTTHKLKEKLGEHVGKGDLIAKVHELQTVTAEIAIPETEIADVNVGQSVVLKARAYPHLSFRGKVVSIAPIANKQEEWRGGRTVLVTTQLDNDALLLKPEMSGNAKIYCGERRIFDLVTRRIVRYLRVEFWSSW